MTTNRRWFLAMIAGLFGARQIPTRPLGLFDARMPVEADEDTGISIKFIQHYDASRNRMVSRLDAMYGMPSEFMQIDGAHNPLIIRVESIGDREEPFDGVNMAGDIAAETFGAVMSAQD